MVKLVLPFVRTPISSQRPGPLKMPGPKSSKTVKRPSVIRVAALVIGKPTVPAPAEES